MKRYLNSLQFRLYATFGLISVVVLIFLVSTSHFHTVDNIRAQQTEIVGEQRTNGYVLITLLHRYIDVHKDDDRESLRTLINETMTSTSEVLNALEGNNKNNETTTSTGTVPGTLDGDTGDNKDNETVTMTNTGKVLDALNGDSSDNKDSETTTSTGTVDGDSKDKSEGVAALDQPELVEILDTLQSRWTQFQAAIQALFQGDAEEFETLIKHIETTGTAFAQYADGLETELQVLSEQSRQRESAIYDTLVALVFIMLLVATWVVIQCVRSINRLEQTARDFAAGNLRARAQVRTLNEIAQVGSTFNNMADRLQELVSALGEQVIEAKKAREQAEKADQVKSAFLAGVSHELRTPLNAIINFSKFVLKGVMGPVNERQVETLTKVVDSGKHLLNLINDVLDISKIEAGALKLLLEPDVDVADLIQQTCGLASGLLVGKPVRFQFDVANDLPHMTTDRQRFRQIMTNILSNACKFTEEGSIKVTSRFENNAIHISVQDTGPGIAPEDYSLVFESFRQTQSGLRQGTGTGLGMPISKSLTEALGGKMWFESEVGKGSTFFVTLPVKTDTIVETQETAPALA